MRRNTLTRWMNTRPLMLFAVCFVLGEIIGYQNAVDWRIWSSMLAAFALFLCLFRKKAFLFCCALFFGAMLVTLAQVRPQLSAQDDVLLTGTIADVPSVGKENTCVPLKDVFLDGEALSGGVLLYIYPDEENELPISTLSFGMTVSAEVKTRVPSGASNPYGYDYAKYLLRNGFLLTATTSSDKVSVLSYAPPSLSLFFIECRSRIEQVIRLLYDEQTAPLVCSLIIGDRSLLPEEVYEQFRVTGLAHLLAISGLHISCLAAALDYVLRKLRCPKGIILIFVTLLLLFYAALIGFPASICRAVIMYVLSAGARLVHRRADGFTSLSIAAMVLLLINPLCIADPSFILSFSSVSGLLGLTRLFIPRCIFRIENFLYTPVLWIVSALAASLSAQLASLPAIACLFGELPVYSLLSNLPALPMLTLALPFIILSVILGFVFPSAGALLAAGIEYILKALLYFIAWVSKFPFAIISSPVWSVPLIALYAAVCVSCMSISRANRRTGRKLAALLPVIALCALLRPLSYPKEGLEILFLDAGQADAAVIRAEDQYYLMDIGEYDTAASYLRASGIRPSGIFISHPHSDHAGGLKHILKVCPPSVIYLPVQWEEIEPDEGIPELIKEAQKQGWIVRTLSAGDTLALSDNVKINIHQPWENMTDDPNGISLVMSVCFGESSALFTGDLPSDDEYALFPDCDVLKTAHHGSKYSTSKLFLKMTSPSAAVISVGHNNYGHPAPELLERLQEAGTSVYRTDQCGAVSVLLDGKGGIFITPFNSDYSPYNEAEAAA